MTQTFRSTFLVLALGLMIAGAAIAAPPPGTIVDVEYGSTAIGFNTLISHDGMTLTVTGPRKFIDEQLWDPDKGGFFDARGVRDGIYRWEVRAIPRIDPEIRQQIKQARKDNNTQFVCDLQDQGVIPLDPQVQNGSFTVFRGQIQDPNTSEEEAEAQMLAETSRRAPEKRMSRADGQVISTSDEAITNLTAADFVINDDLIVDGSACIGFDCVNGEVFSFDTIRLKENNLRIKFDDTSVVPSFPANDWQLTANESANGGASKFSIEDVTNSRTPFTVEANARSHSLYVDDGGRIGSRTSTPSVEIHTIDGDTPTLRLQQDGSSGFEPQTWDVAGNETNFFIRDVTNGSTLPLRIRPSAPSNAIFIDVDGDVGIGTSAPAADVRLHVEANVNSNFAGLRVENEGTGNIQTQFVNNNGDWEWRQNFRGTRLDFNFGTVGNVSTQFTLNSDGSAEFQGDVTANGVLLTSDRNLKHGIEPVDDDEILARIAALPVTTWSFKNDARGVRHIGPMAQDFHAAFGVGPDDRHISPQDAASVALVGIQALYERLLEKERRLDEMLERLEQLETQEP